MSTPAGANCAIDVLITEDDPGLRELLRLLLEGDGYCCAEAENGREAVELARLCHPRLVLLDLMMPEQDGFAAARQIRTDPGTQGVHVYMLTARTDSAARRKADRAGCEVFLTKPIDPTEFLDVVSIAMQS
jgi:CheY-like chemotaxis protein